VNLFISFNLVLFSSLAEINYDFFYIAVIRMSSTFLLIFKNLSFSGINPALINFGWIRIFRPFPILRFRSFKGRNGVVVIRRES